MNITGNSLEATIQTLTSDTQMTVVVPVYGSVQDLYGTICIQRKYGTHWVTGIPVPFIFKANEPGPTILSVSPVSGKPGDVITLTGENFGSDMQSLQANINPGIVGNPHLPSTIQTLISDTQLTMVVPDYRSNQDLLQSIQCARKYGNDWASGNEISFVLKATDPCVTDFYTQNVNLPEYKDADSHTLTQTGVLYINGVGFGDQPGKVFFHPLPGQNTGVIWGSGDREMICDDWSDNQIARNILKDSYFPFDGEFYVQTIPDPTAPPLNSNLQQFHFLPSYYRKQITFLSKYVNVTGTTGDSNNDDYWKAQPFGVAVVHQPNTFSGRSGSDTFFWDNPLTLQNFFVVDRIDLILGSDEPRHTDRYKLC